MRRAAPALIASLLAACEVDPTQLVVVVRTDMSVPDALDEFRVRVRDGRGRAVGPVRPFELEGDQAVALPATFGVAPRDGDADRRVTVEIDALRDRELLFTTRARTGFLEHQALRLDLWLAGRCTEEFDECTSDQACGRLGCADAWIPPESLPPWRGLDASAPLPDAGLDAAPDAAQDAGQDAGSVGVAYATSIIRGATATAVGVAVDSAHTAYVVGSFSGEVDLDDVDDDLPYAAAGDLDMFLSRVPVDGEREWTLTFGTAGATVSPSGMEVLPDGSLLVVGATSGPATICGQQGPQVEAEPFLLKLDAETGECLELRFFQGSTLDSIGEGRALAVAQDGSAVIGGWFTNGLWLGDGVELFGGPTSEAFAVPLAGTGAVCAVDPTGGGTSQTFGLSFDANGGLVVAGGFAATDPYFFDLDGLYATSTGAYDVFVAWTGADCTTTWLRTLGTDIVTGSVLASLEGGATVVFGGTSRGDVTLDGEAVRGLGEQDILLARLDPEGLDGQVVILGGDQDDRVDDAVRADGVGLLFAGTAAGLPNLHGEPYRVNGPTDGYVLAVGDDLVVQWVHPLGGPGEDSASAVAWDADLGAVLVAGESTEGLWLDAVHLHPGAQPRQVFLERFALPAD